MRTSVVIKYTGLALLLNAVFLFISFLISVLYNDAARFIFLYVSVITVLLGSFPLIFVPRTQNITGREGIMIVVACWLSTCIIGALPFFLWGGEFTFINALFESVSGYTTTGASVLTDIESLPKSILFWRSATHWLGGVGIVLFVLVIIPNIGQEGLVLFQSEMSRLAKENFKYRTKTAIQVLLWVYLGLTVSECILLMIFGMDWFDAISHTFATVATGGFSTKNISIAHFDKVYIELIIVIFMFLSGIHFGLLFATVVFRRTNIFASEVVKYYFFATLIFISLITIDLCINQQYNFFVALRHSTFQSVSIITTTGFATVDTTRWTFFSQLLIIFFSIHCACSGSTASGIKADRFLILWKSISRSIRKIKHPNAVLHVKINHKIVPDEIITQTLIFISLYLFILFGSTALVSFSGVDLTNAFSGAVATLGNVGPGFGDVGSQGNYSCINEFGKIVFMINMLFGRLEIFVFLSFFNIK